MAQPAPLQRAHLGSLRAPQQAVRRASAPHLLPARLPRGQARVGRAVGAGSAAQVQSAAGRPQRVHVVSVDAGGAQNAAC